MKDPLVRTEISVVLYGERRDCKRKHSKRASGRSIWDCRFRIADFDVGNILTASMKLVLLSIILLTASSAFGQCPTVTVISPQGVTNVGDKMVFRAEVGAVGPKLEFYWSVSLGTIVAGQGTPSIELATDRRMGGANVTATVTVGGLAPDCEKTASETAPVAPRLEWGSLDQWGPLKDNEQRSRFDTFFSELANNPHQTGLVVLLVTKRERRDHRNRRIQLIMDHVRFRNFDANRIWFCLERSIFEQTTIYRFPPGLEDEIPYENCLIIKGGDIR